MKHRQTFPDTDTVGRNSERSTGFRDSKAEVDGARVLLPTFSRIESRGERLLGFVE